LSKIEFVSEARETAADVALAAQSDDLEEPDDQDEVGGHNQQSQCKSTCCCSQRQSEWEHNHAEPISHAKCFVNAPNQSAEERGKEQ